jgi:hypothetical protein
MGIIKTAMMAGAGMYAVNKYAQTRQNQQPSRQPQQQYFDQGIPQQRDFYQGSNQVGQQYQQQQRVMPMEFSDRRGSPQQGSQPQYLLTNDSSAPVPVYGYDAEKGYYYEIDPRAMPHRAPAMAYADRAGSPPQYQDYPPQRQGFVEADEVSDAGFSNRGSGSGSAALMNTLMQHAGGLREGKGKNIMEKFIK